MKVIIEPTPELWPAPVNGVEVPCRIWKGCTDKGTKVELYVLSIVPEEDVSLEEEVPEFMRPSREVFTIKVD